MVLLTHFINYNFFSVYSEIIWYPSIHLSIRLYPPSTSLPISPSTTQHLRNIFVHKA